MQVVYFKAGASEPVGLRCTRDGRIGFAELGREFKLDPSSIKLNGVLFPKEGLQSEDIWEDIKKHFITKGKPVGEEDDPIIVTGEAAVPAVSTMSAAEPNELVKEFSQGILQLQQLQTQMGDFMEMVMAQVDSSSSFLPSVTERDKGVHVTSSIVKSIVPKPLSAEEAETLWPEICWINKSNLSREKFFIELLSGFIDDASLCWKIGFSGSSPSVCGRTAKPDAVIYKRPLSEKIGAVALTTAAIIDLQSSEGKYDTHERIGKAARYGEKMLENLMGFRETVLVCVTNLEKVLWFKVIMVKKGRFRYEQHVELNDVRGSLCAILKSSLNLLEVEVPVLIVSGVEYEPIRFLGFGATSNVLCVRDENAREYAAKNPRDGMELWNDYEMLDLLKDVKGVPKTLGWFDNGKSLRIHPVGEKISHKSFPELWSFVPRLVDVLESAHKCGIINRDVRPNNIMIVKGESEAIEMLYILDWGFAVPEGKPCPFTGGVRFTSERVLEELASGNRHVMVNEKDDTEALVHTIFALRYKGKCKKLRIMKDNNFDGIRRFWSECSKEYLGWQSAWAAARLAEYKNLKIELEKMVP